ncbi:MAG: hypothetical protein FWG68_09510 [Defluviitaleaceae bacterium]|nr:hypothetical protein [Defluviitaleaceae bacterium]
MYKLLENNERLTHDEIWDKYEGKWVYVVDTRGPIFGFFESGIVAVEADRPFAGLETGIYDELDDKYDGRTADLTINIPGAINVFGFTEVPVDDL